ncbi:hypothetical protein [Neobacillus rhizophilus]|uniref:Uncharacterized protein n=1 Tax=Neobacillus rhizophilus TaxID=2833579 RepID=A0A942YX91_9BACI|nr:hypothetical protein [Neobacillus rhizophilus]MBS4214845.1 hypothetical protein [Neobacillus rhizophilus]MBU8918921.1 hypothetical protein [Bacillus sp. FJAT-29953]
MGSKWWKRIIRNFGISFMGALFTGILYGVLLRLVMGIIAFFFPHMASGFHLSGTLLLVVLGIAVTLANSILYTIIFQTSRMSLVRKGFYYGLLSLIIFGVPMFLSNPNNELFGPQAPLGISLFSVLFFIGAFIHVWSINRITNWVNHSNGMLKLAYISFAILVIPAAVMLFNMFLEIFNEIIPKIIENFSL